MKKTIALFVVMLLLVACVNPLAKDEVSSKTVQPEKLSFSSEWVAANFQNDYFHSYELKLPKDLSFQAGGDTDGWSRATVEDKNGNIVFYVTDFALLACPKDDLGCSIDELKPIGSEEFYALIKEQFELNKDYQKSSSELAVPEAKSSAGFVKMDLEEIVTEEYLVDLGNGVILITFENPEKLPEKFVSETLKTIISSNKKPSNS